MGLLTEERAAARRRAKLDDIREQIASGDLVIRQMTKAERERWARQHAAVEARLTATERAQRTAALRACRANERKARQLTH